MRKHDINTTHTNTNDPQTSRLGTPNECKAPMFEVIIHKKASIQTLIRLHGNSLHGLWGIAHLELSTKFIILLKMSRHRALTKDIIRLFHSSIITYDRPGEIISTYIC